MIVRDLYDPPSRSPGGAGPAGTERRPCRLASRAVPGATPSGVTVYERPRHPIYRDPRKEADFRRWQAAWRRRIAFSRRLEPLEDGASDPLAPAGRWAC